MLIYLPEQSYWTNLKYTMSIKDNSILCCLKIFVELRVLGLGLGVYFVFPLSQEQQQQAQQQQQEPPPKSF